MEGDDLGDRMAGRFSGGEEEKSAEDDESVESEENGSSGESDKSAWSVGNIRQSDRWRVMQLHLPEEELATDFDEAWYDFQAETQGEYQKDRHFKPLLIALGLEALEDLEREGLIECLEHLGESP